MFNQQLKYNQVYHMVLYSKHREINVSVIQYIIVEIHGKVI
jgi:hypothetical protein